MDQKIRCQSCGMPLGEGFYGTNADGTQNEEYCKFCFQKGAFTEPELNLHGMIKKSVRYMTEELALSVEKAREMSLNLIPRLKRWQN
jgi:hypothetical protein